LFHFWKNDFIADEDLITILDLRIVLFDPLNKLMLWSLSPPHEPVGLSPSSPPS
jgi:hypothetical protein